MAVNQSRCVVCCRPSRGNSDGIDEAVCGAIEAISTIHRLSNRGATILSFGVHLLGFGIKVVKVDLNLKGMLLTLTVRYRGTESQC